MNRRSSIRHHDDYWLALQLFQQERLSGRPKRAGAMPQQQQHSSSTGGIAATPISSSHDMQMNVETMSNGVAGVGNEEKHGLQDTARAPNVSDDQLPTNFVCVSGQ
jgi:hypothetical protein